MRVGGWARVPLDEAGQLGVYLTTDVDLLALEEALRELAEIDPELCRLVELRFFAGLSVDDTADVLGVSPSTVDRDWRLVKAWLFRRLRQGAAP